MNEDSIFAAALSKTDPIERADYLDVACGGDSGLRLRIEQRLAEKDTDPQTPTMESNPDDTAGFIAPPPVGSPLKEGPGSLIGPYKLLHPIGTGGMGVVYLAEQQYPVHRQVALKIIKQGMDSEQIILRFEAERQALALMDHPNIAKVLDAGTTDSGRPYFVMELVKGTHITRYCDNNQLTVRQRLELFIPVCQAIQHAHQKGIIHRDIKPSNVLVAIYDGKPVPKVIDFGIAKATGEQPANEAMFTQIGAVIGTLEYMSPERAESAVDVDTRSDIYSLGAMLYELLTGVTPLASSQSAYFEMLRKIREDEPLSPSSRLSQSKETLQTTSEQRKTDPGRLPKLLRGELDWIVMKALEKDRTRRYETANGFARDIERYLSGDPVEAGPPSAAYRLQKFASKNRGLLGTVAAFVVLLVLGAVVSTWQAVRARRAERAATRQRDRADAEAATAKAVTDFLQNGLLSQASAQQQSGLEQKIDPDVKVRTLLDRAAGSISDKFPGQPLVEADIRSTIGNTYLDLYLIPQAEFQFQKAYDLSARYRGSEDPVTLSYLSNLAAIKAARGSVAEAAGLAEKVVQGLTRAVGPEDPRTVTAMQALGVDYMRQGNYAKAEILLKQALAIQLRRPGLDHIETLDTSDSLATLYRYTRRYAEGVPLLVKGLESYKRLYGPGHPFVLREMYGLATMYMGQEKYALAEPLLQQVLEGNIKLLGKDHPNTLSTLQTLANLYGKEGKYAQALATQQQAYAGFLRSGSADLPMALVAEGDLAGAYEGVGDTARAESTFKDSIERDVRVLGPTHPDTLSDMSNLAYLYETHKHYAQALPLQMKIKELSTARNGPEDLHNVTATTMIGKDYMGLHQYQKAEPALREVLAIEIKSQPDNWKRYNLESLLGEALMGEKKYVEAEPLLLSGYQGMKEREGKMTAPARVFVQEDGERLVELYKAWGKPKQAAEWEEKLQAGTVAKGGAKQ